MGSVIDKVLCGGTIQFSFLEFEQGLQKTRLALVDMKAVLEEYLREPLITTRGRQREEQERRKKLLDGSCEYFEENVGREAAALVWLWKIVSKKKYGYQLLMKEYAKDEKQAELLVWNVGNAMMKPKELTDKEDEYLLVVLAAEIIDNPHYFDRNTTAGLFFVYVIRCCENMEPPEDAHQQRKVLTQVSIVLDNISSMVHGYGFRLLTKQEWYGAYDTFCERRKSYVITVENMEGITGVQAVGEEAYIVEDETIFSYLTHNLKNLDYTPLCISSQPRSVTQVLIIYILAGGLKIYCNGDIDPDGICTADRLWKKFGDRIHIWRVSSKDYGKSLSKERTGGIGRAKLENIGHSILKKTAECTKERRLVGYQENMLEELLEGMQN